MRRATDGLLAKLKLHVGKKCFHCKNVVRNLRGRYLENGKGGKLKPINFAVFSIEARLIVLATWLLEFVHPCSKLFLTSYRLSCSQITHVGIHEQHRLFLSVFNQSCDVTETTHYHT